MNDRDDNPNPYLKVLERRLRLYHFIGARLNRVERILSMLRLAIFILFLAIGYAASKYGENWLTYTVVLILASVFAFLVYRQAKIKRKITTLKTLVGFSQSDISRITLDWPNIPSVSSNKSLAGDDKASDLDIVGPHSLIQLIDTTSSREAHETLLSALLEPELDPKLINDRQKLIESLVPRYLLLAKLRVAGGKLNQSTLSGEAVLSQLRNNTYPAWGRFLLILSSFLAIVNIVVLVLYGLQYFTLAFTVYIVLILLTAKGSKNAYARIIEVKLYLDRINRLFSVLEKRVDSGAPELLDHLMPMHDSRSSPTELTGRLGKSINALSIRAFPLLHIILNCLLPWDQLFTYRLESIREELLHHFPVWLKVTAETEALCALAHFSRLNPHYCKPELSTSSNSKGSRYKACELGHPLLCSTDRVVNDFAISGDSRIGIITGSNMSGKSAFLRTIGINICLAQAGAVVCATAYMSPLLHLVTCINVSDDLQNGKSLFYCEIEKLRNILASFELAGNHNVMFLIDEILKGTNNRERVIGGKRYLQSLSDKAGFGLVSTHDLEFAKLADEIPNMFNMHFQETVTNNKMVFDHKLREGPCKSTNALRIMEMEGII